MKIIKYIGLGLTSLLVVTLVTGCFVIKRKLTPPPNYLEVSQAYDGIPITWSQDASSEIAALLLPVRLPEIDRTFYMQFDLGARNTIFYGKALRSIEQKYLTKFQRDTAYHLVDFSFHLGQIELSAQRLKVINYGDPINDTDTSSIEIIGTIGPDLIEKKILLLDFINDICHFGNAIVDSAVQEQLLDFSFKYRWVFLPAEVNGKKRKLWYDTGSSAFDLLTSKSTCKKMAKPGAKTVSNESNSWGKTLTTHTIETEGVVRFGTTELNLASATYVEGYSFMQGIIGRATGIGGMIGNKLFIGRQVLIDGQNRKFGIFDSDIQHAIR